MIAYIRLMIMLLVLVPFTLLLLPFQILALALKLNVSKKIPLIWHRAVLRLVGIRVTLKGTIPTTGPLMIIANHISWTDIPVLGSIMELCFIAKQEVNEMPGAGFLSRMQRTVFVKREEKRAVGEQVNQITQRLLDGDVMVLFGEGSTGNGSRVGAFKSSLLGAAQYAISNSEIEKVIIQPVSIAYTGLQGMPLGHFTRAKAAWYGDLPLSPHAFYILLKSAWDVEVTFGEPIEFTKDSKRRVIAGEVRQQVRDMFVKSVHRRTDDVLAIK